MVTSAPCDCLNVVQQADSHCRSPLTTVWTAACYLSHCCPSRQRIAVCTGPFVCLILFASITSSDYQDFRTLKASSPQSHLKMASAQPSEKKGTGKEKATDVPKEQVWFIVRETTTGRAFKVWQTSLKDITAKGPLTREKCLKVTDTEGKPDQFAFYIYSQSMAAAVQVLSSDAIRVTHGLYCTRDHVVQIFVRDANDPSPNTSRATSYQESLKMIKQRLGARQAFPEVALRPPRLHVKGSSDLTTDDSITEDDEKVTIGLGSDDAITVTKDYLLGKSHGNCIDRC